MSTVRIQTGVWGDIQFEPGVFREKTTSTWAVRDSYTEEVVLN
jgi:hypothetical protein